MKIVPFKIPKTKDETIIYQRDKAFVLFDKLHHHEEIQISYIEKGEGSLIVGDTISAYNEGDVVVFGSYLPHVFRSDLNSTKYQVVHSIFFSEHSNLFSLPEFKFFTTFFEDIKNGITLVKNNENIGKLILKLAKKKHITTIIFFLKILKGIAISEKKSLSNFRYKKELTDKEGKRMQGVFEFAMTNFDKNISLNEVANVANMTKNAFCKYFKLRTNKTFFQFLIELRVEKASKLLIKQRDLAIVDVAEQCGFNSLSNFNKKFKEIKGDAPFNYRKVFSKQL